MDCSLACLVLVSGGHIAKQWNARNDGTFLPNVIFVGTFTLCWQCCSMLLVTEVSEGGVNKVKYVEVIFG
jgi:hypothetical protein